jgi:hypothetical protein
VSPVKYELSFHIPEDGILHSDRRHINTTRVSCGHSSCWWSVFASDEMGRVIEHFSGFV